MNKFNKINDAEQERMCALCETYIIEGSSNSSMFLCEGRYCESAYDLLVEEQPTLLESITYKLNLILKYLWPLKLKKTN
jgi:hypothetical protein